MHERCHILLPSFDIYLRGDNDGCMNTSDHLDEHLNILEDGRVIQWETDYSCGCDSDEDCECFVYTEIEHSNLLEILKQKYNNQIPNEIIEILKRNKVLP